MHPETPSDADMQDRLGMVHRMIERYTAHLPYLPPKSMDTSYCYGNKISL
jgi:hypothetical protein